MSDPDSITFGFELIDNGKQYTEEHDDNQENTDVEDQLHFSIIEEIDQNASNNDIDQRPEN